MVVISIDSAANAKMNDFIICSLDVEIDAGGTLLPYLLVASFIVPGPDPAIRLADYSRDFRSKVPTTAHGGTKPVRHLSLAICVIHAICESHGLIAISALFWVVIPATTNEVISIFAPVLPSPAVAHRSDAPLSVGISFIALSMGTGGS